MIDRRSFRSLGILLFILCLTPQLWAGDPLKPIDKVARGQKARIALQVVDLSSGKVLYSRRADEAMIPASTVKLVTTATAFQLLGRDYRFATTIGYRGRLDAGILSGDLIICGSGDPSTASHYLPTDSTRFLSELISAVQSAGIKSIEGDIIVDASRQSLQGINPNWLYEDMGNYYAAPSYAFNWNDNRIDLILSSSSDADSVRILYSRMPHPEVRWINRLQARRYTDTASCYGKPRSTERILTGFVPTHTTEYLLCTDMPDPALYAAMTIRDRLISERIDVGGQAQSSYTPSLAPRLTTTIGLYLSPPLSTLARVVNHRSINPWAESLLLALSPAAIPDRPSALHTVQQYWQDKYGIPPQELTVDDGSGLSLHSRLSVSTLNRILVAMAAPSSCGDIRQNPFLLSLPRVGQEGSVRGMKVASQTEAYLKSGSMTGVRAYAGYLVVENRAYAIAFIANEVKNTTEIRTAVQQTLDLLSTEVRK